jgi:hypothetical protein
MEGAEVSTALVVVNVLFPVAAALTNGEGDPVVSAVHCGVPEIAAPPAFTR